jgi:hypothetical protein
MADLPILFSAPMVIALLREINAPGTGKTQTRRILNVDLGDGIDAIFSDGRDMWEGCSLTGERRTTIPVRYFRGDRLYVREHWRAVARLDAVAPRDMHHETDIHFAATDPGPGYGRHRQGMHMPRWASRITLEVTEVRVERLQDCSAADARAEGVVHNNVVDRLAGLPLWSVPGTDAGGRHSVAAYAALWDHINGPGAWDSNPWVAAYSFRPILGNIDSIPA